MRPGDAVVAGETHGKLKLIIGDVEGGGKRAPVESAPPSRPARVVGLREMPKAGDVLVAVRDESRARDIAELRAVRRREADEDDAQTGMDEAEREVLRLGMHGVIVKRHNYNHLP